ncbi:MAG: HEAT repeat domain-containing protein [Candidatus Saccharicenans sp.]|nr:HEAT repeat domain-containing protein [Candidatus Saccharicenans sp.]
MRALEKFDHSQGEGPALELERIIFSLKDNPGKRVAAEKRLLQFFTSEVSRDARIALSKPLSWIAGHEAARVLASQLLEPEKSDPARYVLERIPGEEADNVLIEALDKAPAAVIPGIVSSLGHRRAKAAVPPLEKLLRRNLAPQVVYNAIEALGNIGGEGAIRVLSDYLKSGDESLRFRAVDALLRIADSEINNKNQGPAAAISDLLLKARLTPVQKLAAWKLKIMAAGENYDRELRLALKSGDEIAGQAAIGLIPRLIPQNKIAEYLGLFSGLPGSLEVQVAAALSYYPVTAARQFLVNLAEKSLWLEARTEALISLGKIGDDSLVEFLVRKSASSRGQEKNAARESLLALRGKSVDDKILEQLSSSPEPSIRNELLLAACERNIRESREYFLKEAANPSADLALVSRGLRAFGDIGLAEDLLKVAFLTEDEAFRDELAGIMAAWARQSARPEARSAYFRNLLGKETDPGRQAILITIIGKIGERNSLPVLRNQAKSQNLTIREAAIRALCDWPEVEARDDLLEIARTSLDLREKVLAIRGLVRLTASEKYRRPEAVVESLKEIYALCSRAEEKKLVLSVFPDFPCQPALEFCRVLVGDPEVGLEARTALEKISQRLNRQN